MIDPITQKLVLNNRLLTCSKFVTNGGIACDVGTDHAYLASYLVKQKISRRVFACDIAKGPLEAANATVTKLGLQDKVTLILSDGLDNVPDEGVTDVIIAGMGGELIQDIVLRAKWLKNGVNLVLQPQTKAAELRTALCKNGFEIKTEKACRDRKFIYTVINASYTGKVDHLNEVEAITGKLDLSDPTAKEYIKTVAARLKSSAFGIARSKDEAQREEAKKLADLANKLCALAEEK
ncbi:MAG: SAM-dependent methyltransferase [Oscillospiraceae bacterium]|nr:SAM-dependent methyltransferase [Oscillospiraceae bacterium]